MYNVPVVLFLRPYVLHVFLRPNIIDRITHRHLDSYYSLQHGTACIIRPLISMNYLNFNRHYFM